MAIAQRRISGRELSRMLGEGNTWVSVRLNGSVSLSLDDVERIAEALNLGVGELLGIQQSGLNHPVAQEIDEVLADSSTSRRTRDRLLEVLGTIMRMYYEKTDRPAIRREPKMRDSRPAEKRTRR
jgi:transcriptional regulator with XRE-family HTH domain